MDHRPPLQEDHRQEAAGTGRYLTILRDYWGYSGFRGIQQEIIESIGSGHDTLGLMPTGGGKSVTFQVPALAMEGVCVVITPLIALMKDQVQHLRERGIHAAAIYSGMSRKEVLTTLDNCILGSTKLLYVSPERLSSDLFQTKLRHINVSFVTVDEAHCISQWGYDFRPSYLHIADIRRMKPEVPVLALTATATSKVIDDIQERLAFREKRVFRMSFERKNLSYVVRQAEDKYREMVHILHSVPGPAIVYVRSRRRARELSQYINDNGISATFYHAGLEPSVKDLRQEEWQAEQTRTMVATNAFGMGIDKSNVRLVIHFDCPDSIEAYFQEAGRAGRDGKRSYAVLLYNGGDERKLHKRIADNFPEKEYIKEVYEHLGGFFQMAVGDGYGVTKAFDLAKFCHTYHLFPVQADAALRLLQRAGYLEYESDPDAQARVRMLISRNDMYQLDSLSDKEERVVMALLRKYGNLFTDYAYIDESAVALEADVTREQVYLVLKGLSHQHLLHFIPQQKTPYITYSQRRVETTFLHLGKEVYEERKKQYTRRIDAMVAYAQNDFVCRSRQLLRYFGEKHSKDCRHCDVCLENYTNQESRERLAPAKQSILNLLADGKPHHISELHGLLVPTRQMDAALKYLIHEEEIEIDVCYLSIKK